MKRISAPLLPLAALVALALTTVVLTAARAQDASPDTTHYQFFPFNVPASLGTLTEARDINNKGIAIGDYLNAADGATHGFIYEQGQFTDVAVPGAVGTLLTAINGENEAVGIYFTNDAQHLFLRAPDGSLQRLPDPVMPGSSPDAYGINNSGTIVGDETDSSGSTHGFILSKGGKARVYDYPGSPFTVLRGINNAGQSVGLYYDTQYNQVRGLILEKNGTARSIYVPGAKLTSLFRINSAGDEVAGDCFFSSSSISNHLGHGFTLNLSTGIYTVVTFPGPGKGTHLFGLNDSGIVAGAHDYTDGGANVQGFLAVPQASP